MTTAAVFVFVASAASAGVDRSEHIGRMDTAGVPAATLAKSAKVGPVKVAAILAAAARPDEAVIEPIEKALAAAG